MTCLMSQECVKPCPVITSRVKRRSIAQPGRALVLGTRGRKFESCCSDHHEKMGTNKDHDSTYFSSSQKRHAIWSRQIEALGVGL